MSPELGHRQTATMETNKAKGIPLTPPKRRIFIIHGTSRPWHTQRHQIAWMEKLIAYFTSALEAECRMFLWSGSLFGPWSSAVIERCWRSLRDFYQLDSLEPAEDVARIIFAKSNGAIILENAVERYGARLPSSAFDLELRVATPLHGTALHAKLFRRRYLLTSDRDLLFRVSRAVLRPLLPWRDWPDPRQQRIELRDLTHYDFNTNAEISVANQSVRLFDFYAQIIRGNEVASAL